MDLTKGYKNHPQLDRFKEAKYPIGCINKYLSIIFEESLKRNYSFDKNKLRNNNTKNQKINVTEGQLKYEFELLKSKLQVRDIKKLNEILHTKKIESNPIFNIISGDAASWERIKPEIRYTYK
jgi:hypothetical protein